MSHGFAERGTALLGQGHFLVAPDHEIDGPEGSGGYFPPPLIGIHDRGPNPPETTGTWVGKGAPRWPTSSAPTSTSDIMSAPFTGKIS